MIKDREWLRSFFGLLGSVRIDDDSCCIHDDVTESTIKPADAQDSGVSKDREWLKNEALAVLDKLFCTLGNGHNWWRPLLWPLLCPFTQSTVFLRSNHPSAQDSGVSDFTQNVLLNVSLFNSWPMIQVLRWDIHRLKMPSISMLISPTRLCLWYVSKIKYCLIVTFCGIALQTSHQWYA